MNENTRRKLFGTKTALLNKVPIYCLWRERMRRLKENHLVKPLRLFAAFFGVGSLLSGCGGSSSSSPPASVADVPATSRSQYGPLEFTLTAPKTLYNRGESAIVMFTVKNIRSSPVQIQINAVAFYSRVTQNEQEIVGGIGPNGGGIYDVSLAAGEAITYPTGWNQRNNKQEIVPLGRYKIYAVLNSNRITEGNNAPTILTAEEKEALFTAPPIEITVK